MGIAAERVFGRRPAKSRYFVSLPEKGEGKLQHYMLFYADFIGFFESDKNFGVKDDIITLRRKNYNQNALMPKLKLY